MSNQNNTNDGGVCRVRVIERRSTPLTGLDACVYDSPAHSTAQARALLRVLLGRDPDVGERAWLVPVAGGTQRIELVEVRDV